VLALPLEPEQLLVVPLELPLEPEQLLRVVPLEPEPPLQVFALELALRQPYFDFHTIPSPKSQTFKIISTQKQNISNA